VLVRHVVGAQFVRRRRVEVVELARAHRRNDLREPEAAHAGTGEVRLEPHVEHGRAGRLRDLEPDGNRVRNGFVPLPAEDERLESDVERLLANLARTEPQCSQIDGGHAVSVPPSTGVPPSLAELLAW
jgi:hypothetical protein